MSRALPAAVAAVALAVTGLAAVASADHGEPAIGELVEGQGDLGLSDPGRLGQEHTGGQLSTDMDMTPVAKEGGAAGWQQLGGSLWRSSGDITALASPSPGVESPTPYDLDFYGVDFLDRSNGFAVGAQCRRDPASAGGPVAAAEVPGCERVPVIYTYRDDPDKGLVWEESYRAADADDAGGFVAAVTWLGPGRALAVGGTGSYPRREQELSEEQTQACEGSAAAAEQAALGEWADDPEGETDHELHDAVVPSPKSLSIGEALEVESAGTATAVKRGAYERTLAECEDRARAENDLAPGGAGEARAWLYESGGWREIDDLPAEMAALQAIDSSPRPEDCGPSVERECAIAGGMRQLWHFADGRFARGYGPELDGGAGMQDASNLRFRVRDIRFAPSWYIFNGVPAPRPPGVLLVTYALAVTSGCCSENLTGAAPARLSFGPPSFNRPCPSGSARCWQAAAVRSATEPLLPDSYYALSVQPVYNGFNNVDDPRAIALRTPGGPSARYSPREPASRLEGSAPSTGQGPLDLGTASTSSLRLVSADGDSRGYSKTGAAATVGPDGVPDWAVGVLRSSGQGLAFNTTFGANRRDDGMAKPDQCTDESDQLVPGAGQPYCSPEAYQRKNASQALYAVPSYALNAYRVAGEDAVAGDEGVGWAVGDHGAILTRGGGVAGLESAPARRGASGAPQPLARGDAFDEHRPPVTVDPGTVPAVAPGTEPAEAGFADGQLLREFPAHAAVAKQFRRGAIVMSRDGSEGWAFTGTNAYLSTSATADVYRYDGVRWVPCDPEGVGGLIAPDPACAQAPLDVTAVARVPLERDSEPSNDDEFEAVAVTASGLYRYRDGSWARDSTATYEDASGSAQPVKGTDVVFTAPDDGWVVNLVPTLSQRAKVEVRHFDGEQWVDCASQPALGGAFFPSHTACGDPGGHLKVRAPCQGAALGLAAAGERVYLFSIRDVVSDRDAGPINPDGCRGTPAEPYPVILYRDRGGAWRGGLDSTDDGAYNPTDGGWDPGCVTGSAAACVATGRPADQGRIESLSVAEDGDGSFQGWAVGSFGGSDPQSADAVMLRLSDGGEVAGASDPGEPAWRAWAVADAAGDYLRDPATSVDPDGQLSLPSEAGRRTAFMFPAGRIGTARWGLEDQGHPPGLAFDERRRRWVALPAPWSVSPPNQGLDRVRGQVHAIAPDNRGGFWAGVIGGGSFGQSAGTSSLYHYGDRAQAPVFEEIADAALGARITALGAGADGTVWLGDERGAVYRYDRLGGWSAPAAVPEWDPARATRLTAVNAIAVGPGGEGVAVGDGGRIANLGERIGLDRAATVGCDPQVPAPPCGTGDDLEAAAVAADGSAIAAGRSRSVVWRPAGGEFGPVAAPPVPKATAIVGVSMPSPERAYLLTDATPNAKPASRVIRGDMSAPGQWSWRFELGGAAGDPDPLTAAAPGSAAKYLTIRDIAVDAAGHGYAVGDGGLLLERTGDRERPWRRIRGAYGDDLRRVALPAGGGEGALIGDGLGRIHTLSGGRFEVARHADRFDPRDATVTQLALTPGYEAGAVEA